MKHAKKLALFVFIDGLGWDVVNNYGFLEDMATHRQAMGTLFGYSASCHPSIYTGVLPQVHGHFSFFIYDPVNSPFGFLRALSLLPEALTSRARVRHLISRFTAKALGYTGYFQLYNAPFHLLPQMDYTEKKDIYQPGGINNNIPTIFDYLRIKEVPFHMSDWRKNDSTNMEDMKATLDKGEIVWAELFMGKLDGVMHRTGPKATEVEESLNWYAKELTVLLELASKRYQDIHFYVYGDHGMTEVRETLDLMSKVEELGLTWGKDYAVVYDSTMARFWFMNSLAKKRITDLLSAEKQGDILSHKYLEEQGANFDGQRYGQLFYMVKPHVLIVPSYMGQRPIKGMHGYETTHKDSIAALVSNTVPDPEIARLDDIKAVMVNEAKRVWNIKE